MTVKSVKNNSQISWLEYNCRKLKLYTIKITYNQNYIQSKAKTWHIVWNSISSSIKTIAILFDRIIIAGQAARVANQVLPEEQRANSNLQKITINPVILN